MTPSLRLDWIPFCRPSSIFSCPTFSGEIPDRCSNDAFFVERFGGFDQESSQTIYEACMDPGKMCTNPDECLQKMKCLIQKFVQDKQLSGGISAGDVIAQQFEKVLFNEAKAAEFMSFRPSEKSRVDVFLRQYLQSYPELWTFCQSLLLLSHGQAEVEQGFSTNKRWKHVIWQRTQ